MKLIQVINGSAALSVWVWKFLFTYEGTRRSRIWWRWSVHFYPDYENGLRYWWKYKLWQRG